MARHFGFVCPMGKSHIFAMLALANELRGRGHKITFYQFLEGEDMITRQGIPYRAVGAKQFPKGKLDEELKTLGTLTGAVALRKSIEMLRICTEIAMAEIPALAREDGIEVLISDEASREGRTIADELGIPFFTISNAVLLLQDTAVPPFFKAWTPSPALPVKNFIAYKVLDKLRGPLIKSVNERRQKLGLPLLTSYNQFSSSTLHISQTTREFEFPRKKPVPHLHFVGPLTDVSVRGKIDFPYERLNGKPLVYASLGTILHEQVGIFRNIAEAMADLPVQLVCTLGGAPNKGQLQNLPGNPIIVSMAPQLDLLKRASLCITHAGLNTALECLASAVPMVAIPISNDQPGVAARVAWHKAGEMIPVNRLTSVRLREAARRVLENPQYKKNSELLQESVLRAGGKKKAADLIEAQLAR